LGEKNSSAVYQSNHQSVSRTLIDRFWDVSEKALLCGGLHQSLMVGRKPKQVISQPINLALSAKVDAVFPRRDGVGIKRMVPVVTIP